MRKITTVPIAGFLVAAIFAGLVYLFAWSSIFSVSTVTVTGAPTPEIEKTITQIAGVLPGENISHRITQLKWIKRVDISRNWISGRVNLAITPRTPSAYFNGATIDASGTIFTLPGFAGGKLPRVSAPTPKLGVAAIDLFQNLPGDFRSHINSLSAQNDANFAMQISLGGRDLKVLWGKNEKSSLKIQVIQALLALEENKNIRRIDVSAPHAPIVK
ncbi:MAG: hypothetical protein RL249_747 [Actinomycetota bacterium]